MAIQPNLFTPRLILRPFDISDGPRVQTLASDKDIARTTLLIPHPYENGMAEQWIAGHKDKYDADEEAVFAVVQRDENILIGSIGLSRLKMSPFAAEMGYWIGKSYWNRGYCTEAARALLTFSFASFHVDRVTAHHMASNEASGQVMKKVGMKKEGRLRKHLEKWGERVDVILYGILKDEFAIAEIKGEIAPG